MAIVEHHLPPIIMLARNNYVIMAMDMWETFNVTIPRHSIGNSTLMLMDNR